MPILASGTEFELRYKVVEEVNTGQVSCSFRALDTGSGSQVFVKALNPKVVSEEAAVRIFLHEPATLRALARRAPQLDLLPVLDLGRWDGRPYFTMPYLVGWSLKPLAKAQVCFHPRSACRVIERCLQILEVLHCAGFTHGDLSPDNIFVETDAPLAMSGTLPEDCKIRLLDYNSVRRLDNSDREMKPYIKPNYVAPEVANGEPATLRSDLYALGMVFYQLLAGNVPYRLRDYDDAPKVSLYDCVPPLPSALEVPRPVEAFIRRLLARNLQERPASASECLTTLGDMFDLSAWLTRVGPPEATLFGALFEPMVVGGDHDETVMPARGISTDRPPERRAGTNIRSSTVLTALPPEGAAPCPGPSESGIRNDTGTGVDWRDKTTVVAGPSDRDAPDEASRIYDVAVPRSGPEQAQPDRVDFSVFAPTPVAPGRSFVLEVWAYVRAQREEMIARATLAMRVERAVRGPVVITRGTELTLLLQLDGFDVRDNQDTIAWMGEVTNVPFIVTTPPSLAHGVYPGQISILHGGMLLSRLVFEIAVGPPAEAVKEAGDLGRDLDSRAKGADLAIPGIQAGPLGVCEERITSAFASYASEDREEVLRRVQGIEAAGVRVFMDVLSLRSGQDWERCISDNIRRNDVFYLFWSANAKKSEWVEKEWRLALSERGIGYIHPIALVRPEEAPPPPELASLHFNDLMLACLRSYAASLPSRPQA